MFIEALLAKAKKWRQPKMSVDKGMDKDDVDNVVYIPHHLYPVYSAIKINEKKNATCSNMDGPRDCQTKWGKSHRERWLSYDITYM